MPLSRRTLSAACLLAVGAVTLFASPGHAAGLLVVSGDANITNALVGNGTAVNPGNQIFFSNVLGSGTSVLVQGSDPGGVDTPVASINTYYNALPGVTSTIQAGAITAGSLAGVNLFVSALPTAAFAPGEISALSTFSTNGGAIFLLGDRQGFPAGATANTNLNALLDGLSSSLDIVGNDLDLGFRNATGGQILPNVLTTGVTSFTYAAVAQVTGGTPLFQTTGGQAFVAAENIPGAAAAPEPASLALLAFGTFAGCVAARRRKA